MNDKPLNAQVLDVADTLTGTDRIIWKSSKTTATTDHRRENPTAPATVVHLAHFTVVPMALPKVQLEYGRVKFWPVFATVKWIDGNLSTVSLRGPQATKAGLGKDERARTFGEWSYRPLLRCKIPPILRTAIETYEGRVPVASASPAVVE